MKAVVLHSGISDREDYLVSPPARPCRHLAAAVDGATARCVVGNDQCGAQGDPATAEARAAAVAAAAELVAGECERRRLCLRFRCHSTKD